MIADTGELQYIYDFVVSDLYIIGFVLCVSVSGLCFVCFSVGTL